MAPQPEGDRGGRNVVDYGLTCIDVDPYWQQIIEGVIIVSAVAFDVRKYVAKR